MFTMGPEQMEASARRSPVLKNLLAVIAGFAIGSIVNTGLVNLSGHLIPPPTGGDVSTMEGLQATMHLFEPRHFLIPFLAHALGTLVGAAMAARIAGSRPFTFAMVIGAMFFAGGVGAAAMLPAPLWFEALDLVLAYFPMAWLGWRLGARRA